MPKEEKKLVFGYFVYLLLVWSSFRYFIRLPEVIEELWFKPVLWLMPIFWMNLMGVRVEFFKGKLKPALIWGIVVGLVYLIVVLVVGQKQLVVNFEKLGVGVVTAVTENLVFAGYLVPLLMKKMEKYLAMAVVAVMYGLIHIPVILFVYQASLVPLMGYLVMIMCFGFVNAWLRVKTNNVLTPIIASVFWVVAAI